MENAECTKRTELLSVFDVISDKDGLRHIECQRPDVVSNIYFFASRLFKPFGDVLPDDRFLPFRGQFRPIGGSSVILVSDGGCLVRVHFFLFL